MFKAFSFCAKHFRKLPHVAGPGSPFHRGWFKPNEISMPPCLFCLLSASFYFPVPFCFCTLLSCGSFSTAFIVCDPTPPRFGTSTRLLVRRLLNPSFAPLYSGFGSHSLSSFPTKAQKRGLTISAAVIRPLVQKKSTSQHASNRTGNYRK